jgi:hypothetical protein
VDGGNIAGGISSQITLRALVLQLVEVCILESLCNALSEWLLHCSLDAYASFIYLFIYIFKMLQHTHVKSQRKKVFKT